MKLSLFPKLNCRAGIAGRITFLAITTSFFFQSCGQSAGGEKTSVDSVSKAEEEVATAPATPVLDTALYDQMMAHMVNGDTSGRWPVKGPYPLPGAILPFKRVIAYYGNLYSKQMGALGEFPRKEMLAKLMKEVEVWQKADSTVETVPALHYIAVTAQGAPGKGNTYRLRMPFHQIDSVLSMAKEINALVFLDIQVGLSTVQSELPEFEKYLKMPNVHFGIDPEFSMKGGEKPGKVIGSFNAADINYVTDYLAKLVRENNLPPKMLVVHRFTRPMVKDYKDIKLRPEVQIIMDMDGWGIQAKKLSTYDAFIYKEPVQFTGFKLFYKNDTKQGDALFKPEQLLKLKPQPIYIQYQ